MARRFPGLAALAAAAVTLCGCGIAGGGPEGGLNEAQLNRLTARMGSGETEAPTIDLFGLEPVTRAELASVGVDAISCGFVFQGQPLVAVVGRQAIVRRQGQPLRLDAAGPIGASGGFFAHETLSLSIGQSRGPTEPGSSVEGMPPARMLLMDRRAGRSTELRGEWRCGSTS